MQILLVLTLLAATAWGQTGCPVGSVEWLNCAAGVVETTVAIAGRGSAHLVDIPAGIENFSATVTSLDDIDIILYSGYEADRGDECLVGFNCPGHSVAGYDTVDGMAVYFSGIHTTQESMTINYTTGPLSLTVYSWAKDESDAITVISWDDSFSCSACVPTSSPSNFPSLQPSTVPTGEPSLVPSGSPTTSVPSLVPSSSIPTLEPTQLPTPFCNDASCVCPDGYEVSNIYDSRGCVLSCSCISDGHFLSIVTFQASYTEVVTDPVLFLSECSAELAPVQCVDVRAGSILVDLIGSQVAVTAAVENLEVNGLDLPSFPLLSTSLPKTKSAQSDESTALAVIGYTSIALLLVCVGFFLYRGYHLVFVQDHHVFDDSLSQPRKSSLIEPSYMRNRVLKIPPKAQMQQTSTFGSNMRYSIPQPRFQTSHLHAPRPVFLSASDRQMIHQASLSDTTKLNSIWGQQASGFSDDAAVENLVDELGKPTVYHHSSTASYLFPPRHTPSLPVTNFLDRTDTNYTDCTDITEPLPKLPPPDLEESRTGDRLYMSADEISDDTSEGDVEPFVDKELTTVPTEQLLECEQELNRRRGMSDEDQQLMFQSINVDRLQKQPTVELVETKKKASRRFRIGDQVVTPDGKTAIVYQLWPAQDSVSVIHDDSQLSLLQSSRVKFLKVKHDPSPDVRRPRLQELVETENTYVNTLLTLYHEYYMVLQTDKTLSSEDLDKLFPFKVQEILNFHRKFRDELDELLQNYDETESRIGFKFWEFKEYLKNYKHHIPKVNKALKFLASQKHNKRLTEFLDNKSEVGLHLEQHLTSLIQRIFKYELLLQAILKCTEEGHKDYDRLERVVKYMREVNIEINEAVHEADRRDKVFAIQQQFLDSPNLIAPGREFIRQDVLEKWCRKIKKWKKYTVFLFNDMMCYAKHTIGDRYKLHTMIPIDEKFRAHCDAQGNSSSSSQQFGYWVVLVQNQEVRERFFMFRFADFDQTQSWLQDLDKCKHGWYDDVHFLDSENPQMNAVEDPDVNLDLLANAIYRSESVNELYTGFWKYLWHDCNPCGFLKLIFKRFKAFLFFIACFVAVYAYKDNVNDFLEDSRGEALDGWLGRLPYLGVALVVFLAKAANGPGWSKSLITLSLTIVLYASIANGSDSAPDWRTVFWTAWAVDTILDVIISFCQLWFSAPRMTGTLCYFAALFVEFVSFFHWIVFPMATVLLVTKPYSILQIALFTPMAALSVFNMIYRFLPNDYTRDLQSNWFFRNVLTVPKEVNDRKLATFVLWEKFMDNNKTMNVTLVHILNFAWVQFFYPLRTRGRTPKYVWLRESWCHRSFMFIPSLIWVWTAEIVNVIDAIFLIPFKWNHMYGMFLLFFNSVLDYDRIITVNGAYKFMENGDFEAAFLEVLWFKALKWCGSGLFGYAHIVVMTYGWLYESAFLKNMSYLYKAEWDLRRSIRKLSLGTATPIIPSAAFHSSEDAWDGEEEDDSADDVVNKNVEEKDTDKLLGASKYTQQSSVSVGSSTYNVYDEIEVYNHSFSEIKSVSEVTSVQPPKKVVESLSETLLEEDTEKELNNEITTEASEMTTVEPEKGVKEVGSPPNQSLSTEERSV